MNIYYVAAIWVGMALLASVVSIRIAVPVALVEIVVGALAGNIPGIASHVSQPEFVTFLASVGSLALTFLAGAEIDPVSLRGHWKASLSVGFVSFLVPFVAAFLFCLYVLGWQLHAAEIGGVALSTTSVAVVYAVMVETGLNRQDLGKLILAACFITDLGTVLALGGLFASYDWLLIVFIAVSAVTLVFLPRLVRFASQRLGHRVSEPEIKLLLVILLGLGPGHPGGQGGGAARLRRRTGRRRGLPARQGADGPAALDCVRAAHAFLLPARRDFDLRSRADLGRRCDRRPAAGQARCQGGRSVTGGHGIQAAAA